MKLYIKPIAAISDFGTTDEVMVLVSSNYNSARFVTVSKSNILRR